MLALWLLRLRMPFAWVAASERWREGQHEIQGEGGMEPDI